MWIYYLILFNSMFHHNAILAFNVEIDHYTIYKGDIESMFGFSVAEYRDQTHHGWVIVGAPLNRTNFNDVKKGGAVLRCDITEDNKCFPIDFDKKGINYVKSTKNFKGIEPIEDKSYQWFGATVSTSMEDGGPLLACAPKYHWFGYVKANWSVAGLKDVIGACWSTTLSNNSSIEYSPCRNNDTAGHHRQGMCQAGVGAALSKDGKRLFIGAPGSWYWQGQLFSIESNTTLPFIPVKDFRSTLLKHGINSSLEQLNLLATNEGPAHEDNSYLGYSVTVGDFLGNGDSGVAVGAPRGSELQGKVLLFTSRLLNHRNITGDQMGAYFGYALAANDIDGDNQDDLIITAPFYTQTELAGIKIETGRIYIFYQGSGRIKYQKFDTRDGDSNRGQFGLSVASLGDIDLDGYGDIVIGEPYGGLQNRGAVYIYYGTKAGLEEKYSQVIYSENLEQPVRTFGWSVSGGLDLDGNIYPDLVVGGYESNTVIYFRSRPVINMYSEIKFLSQTINLKHKACALSDGTAVTCSELKLCCMYTGIGSLSQHHFRIYITLDDKKKNNPRLYFLDHENKYVLNWTVTIMKDNLYCRQIKVYIKEHLRDKLTPLDAELHIELLNGSKYSSADQKRDPRRNLIATLGPKNTIRRDSLKIQKNCGSDDICIPNLILQVTKNVEKYLLSTEKILELEVNVQNIAEDAFESIFYLHLPLGIDYVNIESVIESSEIIIQCSAPKISNNNTLRCDVGNPLSKGKIVKFKIFLQPIIFDGMSSSYQLYMEVNSSNPENPDTIENNKINMAIPVWFESDIIVEGKSKPQEIDFNSMDYSNVETTMSMNTLKTEPLIIHNYTIRNNGPLSILNMTMLFIWTSETLSGDILLHLIQPLETFDNNIRCESINEDYIKVMDSKETWNSQVFRKDSLKDLQNTTINNLYELKDKDTKQKSKLHIPSNKFIKKSEKRQIESSYTDSMNQTNNSENNYHRTFTENVAKYKQYESWKAGTKIVNKRYTRKAPQEFLLENMREQDKIVISNSELICETVKCIYIQCYAGPLDKDEEIYFAARFHSNMAALRNITVTEKIKVSSKLYAFVVSQPFIGQPIEQVIKSYEITSTILSTTNLYNFDIIPLWIVVISACTGTAILLLLVYILYKCGFFKRNRPLAGPESQPLNRSEKIFFTDNK